MNHYSYGAVGGWLHRVVSGLELGEPGYKRILIRPHPGGGLTHAKTSYLSIYGEILSAWEIGRQDFKLEVTVPPNTSARVYLPTKNPEQVTEGGAPLDNREGITGFQQEDGSTVVQVGSGTYHFTCQNPSGY